jgi:hypothetical protein
MTLAGRKARARRLDALLRGLAKEAIVGKPCEDPLLYVFCDARSDVAFKPLSSRYVWEWLSRAPHNLDGHWPSRSSLYGKKGGRAPFWVWVAGGKKSRLTAPRRGTR